MDRLPRWIEGAMRLWLVEFYASTRPTVNELGYSNLWVSLSAGVFSGLWEPTGSTWSLLNLELLGLKGEVAG